MKPSKLLFTVVISLSWLPLCAQEIPIYTQFFTNPYIYNPAYAGVEGRPIVTLTHRRQWVGIEDAPVTSNLVFHTPLAAGFNVGLNVSQDDAGIFKSTGGLLTFGYNVALGYNHFLSFGISGGVKSNSINFDNLNPADPALVGVLPTSNALDGNAGVAYHAANFNLGFALPKLFNTQTYSTDPFDRGEFDATSNYIVTGSYMFFFGFGDYALEPYFLYRSYQEFPTQVEGGLLFHIKRIIWIGAMYRQDYGYSGLLGLKLENGLAIGYAYEQPLSTETGINASTHEFQLTFGFGKKSERSKKYSTFLSDEQVFKPYTEPDEPEEEIVAEDPEPEPEEEIIVEEAREAEDLEEQDEEITEDIPIQEEPIIEEGPTEEEVLQEEVEQGLTRVVRRGYHPFELVEGHYVIVGAFSVMENAIHMSDQLRVQGYETAVAFSSEAGFFYVHFPTDDTPTGARWLRDTYRRTEVFKDAWYLQVN